MAFAIALVSEVRSLKSCSVHARIGREASVIDLVLEKSDVDVSFRGH